MAGKLGLCLGAISLLSLLAGTSAGLAQTERTWVDPPPEAGAQSQGPSSAPTSAPSASPAAPPVKVADPKPAPASPGTAPSTRTETVATEETRKDDAVAEAKEPPLAPLPQPRPALEKQAKENSVAERKPRRSSREAGTSAKSSKRNEAVARRRAPKATRSIEASRVEARRSASRYTRGARYDTAQEGIDAGLEVMRLRTIQLPNGRRISILTRPDPETMADLLGEPY